MYILGKCIHTGIRKCTQMHMHTHSYVYGITGKIRNIIYIILVGFFYSPITISITSTDTRDSQKYLCETTTQVICQKII